ncbi:hypothetical protein ACFRAR_19690 [Kitasatospora sp. NPDC056651]|uniref:hypothetical protein n=1 Tax=Kitasatospora sp. NPDC056651 TaxID=3345892 RepID=UPI0036BE8477
MYLVHTALRPDAPGRVLPYGARDLLLAAARPEDGVEHLAVHRGAVPHPVLGVFLVADSLAEAERRAAAFCCHALAVEPQFTGWSLAGIAVPLIAPYYERLLSEPSEPSGPAEPDGPADPFGPDGPTGPSGPGPSGRNGPGAIPST